VRGRVDYGQDSCYDSCDDSWCMDPADALSLPSGTHCTLCADLACPGSVLPSSVVAVSGWLRTTGTCTRICLGANHDSLGHSPQFPSEHAWCTALCQQSDLLYTCVRSMELAWTFRPAIHLWYPITALFVSKLGNEQDVSCRT
jgi:hypothetical protein